MTDVVVQVSASTAVVTDSYGATVMVETPSASVVSQGIQGPAGVGGSSVVPYIAGVAISSYTAVTLDASGKLAPADCTDMTQVDRVLGIALQSAQAGGSVNVQLLGEVDFNGWNWTLNAPVFLGRNGALTQTQPTTGFVQVLGSPITATRLSVWKLAPLVLA